MSLFNLAAPLYRSPYVILSTLPTHQPHRMANMLQVKVDSHMLNALTADLTARCVVKTKYKHESRHSKDAIAWANSRAEKLTTAMLKHIGKGNTAFNIQLNIVQLLDFHDRAYICYDLFLDGFDEHVRLEIERSIERPIYLIIRRGDILHVNRGNKGVDAMVADELKDIGQFDKGPRPYFVDAMNPPLYSEGKRIENPAEFMSGSGDLSSSEEDEDGKRGEQDSRKEVAGEGQVVTEG
ncbi:hypothetical protein B0J18DRAFT_437114 [Chaetomium sp. MPI-SDFR-AT-0129]|nr:hypothetical protein B0J18DRAFT_437114 [Chaetomium sp. MPI-SDFR-AT-0129]